MDCVYADQVSKFCYNSLNPGEANTAVTEAAFVEQQLCAAYPAVTRGQLVVKVAAVISAIVLPTVAIRLYARIRFTNKLWIDDYATILGAVRVFGDQLQYCLSNISLGLASHCSYSESIQCSTRTWYALLGYSSWPWSHYS